jgi:hypothetical protein
MKLAGRVVSVAGLLLAVAAGARAQAGDEKSVPVAGRP